MEEDEDISPDEEPPEPPDIESATRALQKRDRAFLFRLGLRLGVALLLGVWIALQISQTDIGGCAARGFQTVSE